MQMVSLISTLIEFAVSVLANTVVLFIALTIMLKVQKMDIKWLWLIGAALLASFLDTLFSDLDFPFASRIGHVLAVVSLWLNIYHMSTAEPIDATFTVSVGYAVKFTLNMFLFTALLGDLRPDLKSHEQVADETDDAPPAAAPAKVPAKQTAKATNAAPAAPVAPKVAAAPAAPAVPASPAASAAPKTVANIAATSPVIQATNGQPTEGLSVEQVKQIVKNFVLKGVVPGDPPLAILSTGAKNYTLSPGDIDFMDTSVGRLKVRCDRIVGRDVTLTFGGQTVILTLPAEQNPAMQ